MQDSKAISEDVKELFQMIKAQADEYSNAFELLEQKTSEFNNTIESLNSYKDFFKNEFSHLSADTKIYVNATIKELENRLDKVTTIYDNLDNINSLKEALYQLQDRLKKQYSHVDNIVDEFKNRAEVELGSTLMSLKFRLEKEIDNLSNKYEARIDLKLKRLESQVLNYDQKIISIVDYQNKEFKSLKDDVDSLRYKVNKLFHSEENRESKHEFKNTQILQLQVKFDEKIENINKLIKQLRDEDMKGITDSIPIEAFSTEISNLKNISNHANLEIEATMKKLGVAQAIAIGSLVIAIIALLVGFAI
jgi:chromosome segregation ATPase